MSLLLPIIKENIITKLQKLYSPPRNLCYLWKKPLYMGDLSPTCKIFLERPANMIKFNFLSKILCCCDVIFEIKYPRAESEELHSYPLLLQISTVYKK